MTILTIWALIMVSLPIVDWSTGWSAMMGPITAGACVTAGVVLALLWGCWGAASTLRGAHAKLGSLPHTAELADEMEDLKAEAQRMEDGEYGALDRKYHTARSAGIHSLRSSYVDKVSRRKRKKRD